MIVETILDSGYCNKDEWKSEKERQVKKWQNRGYANVKCILQKTDTKGLRMFITVTKEEV